MEGVFSQTLIVPKAIKPATQYILIPVAPFLKDCRIFPSLFKKITELERSSKVKRYLEKKRKRKFSNHVRYECRRTLAAVRSRQNGRFAKPNSRKSTEDEETLNLCEKLAYEAI